MPDSNVSLPEWLAWLETLSPTEINLGLERVQDVLSRLDLARPPHVLLIGGTNGKGSSVAMADSLLRAAGYTTGAYTSPHVHRYNERIRVNGTEAGDEEILSAFERVEAARNELPLTYFEFGTLAAWAVFADAAVDVWILEVGLGGRLDATNAIDPDASLITNISLDHCDWLGDDIESIAAEKAGIMRPGRPVVYAQEKVPDTIIARAEELGAQLIVPNVPDDLPGLALTGEFQRSNAAGVIALLEAAGLERATKSALVAETLPSVTLKGRSQRVIHDGVEWLFDVAHNPAAAQVLGSVLAADDRRTTAIIGVLDDKDLEGVIDPLRPHVDRWIAVEANSPRAIPVGELSRRIANRCDKACLTATALDEAIEFARRSAAENARILVTGSFFTVGPVLERLDLQE